MLNLLKEPKMNFYKLSFISLTFIAFLSSGAQAKSHPNKEMYDLRVDISVMEKKLHGLGVDVNINEVPDFGSQYLQDQALRSQYTKLKRMIDQLN